MHEFAAFDCHPLRRPNAEADCAPDVLARAKSWCDAATEDDRDALLASIIAGLPSAIGRQRANAVYRLARRESRKRSTGKRPPLR